MDSERQKLPDVRELLWPALGALILLVAVGIGALTEKSQIDYLINAQRHGGDLLDLGTDGRPGGGQQGYMVRVVGPLQVVQSPLDTQFNQQSNAPVLTRHVQMFEWKELRFSGPATYEMDWADHPIDASHFEHPEGHANPTSFPLDNARFDAGEVRVNGFVLSPTLVHALPGSQSISPNMGNLPSNLAASFSLYNDALVTSSNPSNPVLGDVKVSWEAVPIETVTIVAKLDGNRLVPAADAADGVGYALQIGDSSLADMFPDTPVAPEYLWLRRALSMLLAALGIVVLLRWHYKHIDPLLAAGTTLLVVGAIDAMLWLGHDANCVMTWLAVAVIGAALVVWRVRARASGQGHFDPG